ncbi:MAG TPA: peptidoglycan DD-metalloendopeptidase family protein [Pseudomonadales bacterium]|jgi:murein DD-endopeptidase MepM/ murein hydrolase activator NlpD
MLARAALATLCWLTPMLLRADAVPGGLYAYGPVPPASEVRFDDRRVLVIDETALVGIPLSASPGTHSLTITYASGESVSHQFEVVAKQYPEQRLTITDRKMVNPDPEDLERIRTESARMREQYLSFTEAMQRLRPFHKPVNGVTSSPFGRRRILNDQPRNPHSGLDIAADHGTPVSAPAPARVSLTGDFYFNGKTIFLDHGQGLVTMYCHLSEISVEPGEAVERGATIGLVGATGRATGPHLHWSVSLNGNRVDPELVISALAVGD